LGEKSPDSMDRHVGTRVRMRRLMLGMTQEMLGEALGLSSRNRISAGHLQRLSAILKVPVSFFFEGATRVAVADAAECSDPLTPSEIGEFLTSSDGLALVQAFMRIKSDKLRRRIANLTEEIGARNDSSRSVSPSASITVVPAFGSPP
jgi:transcriptional regulator with XRE-family HTH domain